MQQHECKNCGAAVSTVESRCKYCGSANEYYEKPKVVVQVEQSTQSKPAQIAKKSGSTFVFVLLLICCWPLAILYALANFKK